MTLILHLCYNKILVNTPSPEFKTIDIKQALREEQNAIEESLRDEFLQNNLFHEHLLVSDYSDDFVAERQRIHDQFMRDKKGKNMGERMELALSDEYLNKINVVELGHTTRPDEDGHADGLKKDYIDLRNWMLANNWIDDEISRSDSGRTVSFHNSKVTRERKVVIRNRPLIDTVIEHSVMNGEWPVNVRIRLAKRMVFSVPTRLIEAYGALADHKGQEFVVASVEQLLDRKSKHIDPIRTSYYLSTELVKAL